MCGESLGLGLRNQHSRLVSSAWHSRTEGGLEPMLTVLYTRSGCQAPGSTSRPCPAIFAGSSRARPGTRQSSECCSPPSPRALSADARIAGPPAAPCGRSAAEVSYDSRLSRAKPASTLLLVRCVCKGNATAPVGFDRSSGVGKTALLVEQLRFDLMPNLLIPG